MISVNLEMPPSANRIWRRGKGNTHRSAEYVAWRSNAAKEVLAARKGRVLVKPVKVEIGIRRGHKGRDLDNQLKPLLDALQLGRLVVDDNQIHDIRLSWLDHDAPRPVLIDVAEV